jgi:hypothetical protein
LNRTCSERLDYAKFVAGMCAYCVMGHQLIGDLLCERMIEATSDIDRSQFLMFSLVVSFELRALTLEFSLLAWEWTDTYSPAAIAMAPATRPATPATNTLLRVPCAAATPSTKLAVETIPSFAPSTAARSQPMRPVRCRSFWTRGILNAFLDDR